MAFLLPLAATLGASLFAPTLQRMGTTIDEDLQGLGKKRRSRRKGGSRSKHILKIHGPYQLGTRGHRGLAMLNRRSLKGGGGMVNLGPSAGGSMRRGKGVQVPVDSIPTGANP
jgi:hypothetical protein